jgi:Protein phosphatase 2C
MPVWRTAYASVTGTSHAATGTPCQDAGLCEVVVAGDGTEILIAAVADGAGSAAHSEAGSRMTVNSYVAEFGSLAVKDPTLASANRAIVIQWMQGLRDSIRLAAATEGHKFSEYACTFLGAVVGPTRAMFVQIGDGAIVVRDAGSDDYSWVFWPQNGEYANSTNFITQKDLENAVEVEFANTVPIELCIFSDGIERLVLDMRQRIVHTPALRPIFQWLARTEAPNGSCGESPPLVAFLRSEKVNSRTDDDKTLVVATRAIAEGEP